MENKVGYVILSVVIAVIIVSTGINNYMETLVGTQLELDDFSVKQGGDGIIAEDMGVMTFSGGETGTRYLLETKEFKGFPHLYCIMTGDPDSTMIVNIIDTNESQYYPSASSTLIHFNQRKSSLDISYIRGRMVCYHNGKPIYAGESPYKEEREFNISITIEVPPGKEASIGEFLIREER